MDGSPAREPPIVLAGVDEPAVSTKVRVVRLGREDGDAAATSCLRESGSSLRPGPIAVVRIGVSSESVTFREWSGRSIFGCDNSPGPREGDRRWCGAAYGRVVAGRLADPRLNVVCDTVAGEPMGFVWVQPPPAVRYVVVRQEGFSEVYEVAGGLPVRLSTTSGVEYERARATFDVSEHDAEGDVVRRYLLEAFVAG